MGLKKDLKKIDSYSVLAKAILNFFRKGLQKPNPFFQTYSWFEK